MIISTNRELRMHLPSNAVDDIGSLQGILDNSENDFLRDKLGDALHAALCEQYRNLSPDDFCLAVANGEHVFYPWQQLLLYAQRMVAFDAVARFIPQQALSVNGTGVNVASSEDYGTASEKLIDKGVQGYKREAMLSLNQMLVTLEGWAATPAATAEASDADTSNPDRADEQTAIAELWKQSQYYYLHKDLLISTCAQLQRYIDVYDSRERFIRLLPDLHFIQDEYICDAVGEDTVNRLLTAPTDADAVLLRKLRRLMVAHLEERTTVLSIDKARRQKAHDEAIALRASVLRIAQQSKPADAPTGGTEPPAPSADTDEGYKNNQPGSKIFVSPMLF